MSHLDFVVAMALLAFPVVAILAEIGVRFASAYRRAVKESLAMPVITNSADPRLFNDPSVSASDQQPTEAWVNLDLIGPDGKVVKRFGRAGYKSTNPLKRLIYKTLEEPAVERRIRAHNREVAIAENVNRRDA